MGLSKTFAFSAMLLCVSCSTETKLLKLEKSRLERVSAAAAGIDDVAGNGSFDPKKSDLYLLLNNMVFDTILASFDNSRVSIVQGGRTIDITLRSLRLAFRPGSGEVAVSASALDRKTGIKADVVLDGRLIVEGDKAVPGSLYLRFVASKVVPKITWGLLDFTKLRFVRELAGLELGKLTERIPRISIPLENKFSVGGPAGQQALQIPTGGGSITGTLSYPATRAEGAIRVRNVLFLRNGVHVFADVEGL